MLKYAGKGGKVGNIAHL